MTIQFAARRLVPSDLEESGYLAETEVSELGRRVGQLRGDSAKFGVGGGCGEGGGGKLTGPFRGKGAGAKDRQGDALG